MPRIYVHRPDLNEDEPIDLCRACFPIRLRGYQRAYCDGLPIPGGAGFDADAEHPPYEGEQYSCSRCGKRLTEQDNDAERS